jgi:hypothetical protein
MREDAEGEFDREDIAAYAALGGVTMSKTTTHRAGEEPASLERSVSGCAARSLEKEVRVMRKWLILLLTMFVVPSSVFATNNGLSEKQVRAIVKEAVAKTRPGKDGGPILSAHIFASGRVDHTTPGGITQENVRRVDLGDGGVVYCFSGLPPVVGGQVTLDGLQSLGED